MRIHGGIVFPETASLFMHCLKWIAQLSRDKKWSARASHFLINRQENELSREQRPWWCPQGILMMVIFTFFLEADLASFPFLICRHSCTSGSFYSQRCIIANDCPLVMLSRPPEAHFHTLQHSSSCWGNWIWAGYKNKEFSSSSSFSKIPSPQHILPGRFCIPGIPPTLQAQPWAYGFCLSGTDWIKYCSHSRWWNQDLQIKITGLMSQR